jgi:arylsulfatase A-like enzyme
MVGCEEEFLMSKKAVFLITIDDVRADHTSMEGWKRDTTPFLQEFSQEAEYLENHFSAGASSPTSFRTIFSSTLPMSYFDYDELSQERPFLPEILSQNEVRTVGFTTNPFVSEFFGFNRGFDNFMDYSQRGPNINLEGKNNNSQALKQKISNIESVMKAYNEMRGILKDYQYPYLKADKVNDCFKQFIDSEEFDNDKLFFWIHYMDAHEPFVPPEETIGTWSDYSNPWVLRSDIEQLENEEEWGELSKIYDEGILYLDSQIEKMVNLIEHEFSDREVSIIIASDHGELIGENNEMGHFEKLEGSLYSVPALIKTEEDLRLDGTTSHMDIAPTIIDILDIEIPEDMGGVALTQIDPPERRLIEACADGDKWRKDSQKYQSGIVGKHGLKSNFVIGQDSIEEAPNIISENIPDLVKLWDK